MELGMRLFGDCDVSDGSEGSLLRNTALPGVVERGKRVKKGWRVCPGAHFFPSRG